MSTLASFARVMYRILFRVYGVVAIVFVATAIALTVYPLVRSHWESPYTFLILWLVSIPVTCAFVFLLVWTVRRMRVAPRQRRTTKGRQK